MQKWLISGIMALGFVNAAFAQSDYDAKVRAYIEKYKSLAVAEQRRSGIPAAITLAQGIHETQAGCSELATMANNHFGIKCKKEWTGETFAHTDDAPNECFRKYSRSEDSYLDHSNYLRKSPRYAELFKLSITDYPAWAVGLRKCGYATNPRYAQVLIKLVEDYHLQEFTYAALDNAEIIPEKDAIAVAAKETPASTATARAAVPVSEPVAKEEPAVVTDEPAKEAPAVVVPVANIPPPVVVAEPPADVTPPATKPAPYVGTTAVETAPAARPAYGKEVKVNGLRAIYGRRGETPLGYAYNAGVRYSKLLDMNEIDERPLPVDMYLYLERKHTRGMRETHVVKPNETLFMVAQEEGMQIKSLMDLNMLVPGEEPVPGTVLQLQNMTTEKPVVTTARKAGAPSKIKAGQSASVPARQPVAWTPPPAPKPAPARVSKIQATENNELPARTEAATQPREELVASADPAPVTEMQEIEKPEEPVATTAKLPQEIPASSPAVATIADPTHEEAGKDYPRQAEPRYVIDETPIAAEPKAEPAKPLAISETPASISAAPIKEKQVTTPVVDARPVAVPAVDAPPKDELDRLKRKFDRVVYAGGKPAATPPPASAEAAEPVKQPEVTPVVKEEPQAESKNGGKDDGKYYTVKKGDTGFLIARKNNITLTQLMKLNNMDFKNIDIKEGQKLKVKP